MPAAPELARERHRDAPRGGVTNRARILSRRLLDGWKQRAGGPVRAKVTFLLACVLGLDTADLGSVGAIAGKLEHALRLSNTQLGLLAAAPAVSSAVMAVPMGVLVDRVSRTRLLWITMLGWGATEALSGLAQSFEMLLLVRIALGAATAGAMPAVASLVGDLFPARERGRIWGLILSGELIGSAFGYMIAGEAASLGSASWRYAFWVLVAPGLCGALAIRRLLPEPARGGRSCLARGATVFVPADRATNGAGSSPPGAGHTASDAQKVVEQQRVQADPALVLRDDPQNMSLLAATRYVLRVRTNVVLIIASGLGYFYFTGVTTFGLFYFQQRYHVPHGTATLLLTLLGIAGLLGVIAGGRIADRLLQRGDVNGRITVGAMSFALAAVLFLPGLLAASVTISLPMFMLAAIAFGARNPPLDAARLDIIHHRLWGRAEAVRTFLRRTMTATAPILFGLLADQLVRSRGHAGAGGPQGFGSNASAHGLRLAFLVLLATLAVGGLLTFLATRTYPRDAATALASENETRANAGADHLPRAA